MGLQKLLLNIFAVIQLDEFERSQISGNVFKVYYHLCLNTTYVLG